MISRQICDYLTVCSSLIRRYKYKAISIESLQNSLLVSSVIALEHINHTLKYEIIREILFMEPVEKY